MQTNTKSAAAHTPGPWIVGSSGTTVLACTPVDNVGPEVTSAPFPVVVDTASGHDSMSYAEAAANAKLIAALPNLIAALRDVVATHDDVEPRDPHNAIAHARAALAKAGAL